MALRHALLLDDEAAMTSPTLQPEPTPSPPEETQNNIDEERLTNLLEEKRMRERLSRQIAFGEGL